MSDTAVQTPLTDLLDRVPTSAIVSYQPEPFASHSIPVGRLCAEAAARIRELEQWKQAVIDGLMVAEIYMDAHESDPRAALEDLNQWRGRFEAELLRVNVRELETKLDEARRNYQFMVERAADEKLDGYRELGDRAARAENERDQLKALLAAHEKCCAGTWVRCSERLPENGWTGRIRLEGWELDNVQYRGEGHWECNGYHDGRVVPPEEWLDAKQPEPAPHNRLFVGVGYLEQTGYIDPPSQQPDEGVQTISITSHPLRDALENEEPQP